MLFRMWHRRPVARFYDRIDCGHGAGGNDRHQDITVRRERPFRFPVLGGLHVVSQWDRVMESSSSPSPCGASTAGVFPASLRRPAFVEPSSMVGQSYAFSMG